jgi:hypothetical protein
VSDEINCIGEALDAIDHDREALDRLADKAGPGPTREAIDVLAGGLSAIGRALELLDDRLAQLEESDDEEGGEDDDPHDEG